MAGLGLPVLQLAVLAAVEDKFAAGAGSEGHAGDGAVSALTGGDGGLLERVHV